LSERIRVIPVSLDNLYSLGRAVPWISYGAQELKAANTSSGDNPSVSIVFLSR
jgi:hypothetical protein